NIPVPHLHIGVEDVLPHSPELVLSPSNRETSRVPFGDLEVDGCTSAGVISPFLFLDDDVVMPSRVDSPEIRKWEVLICMGERRRGGEDQGQQVRGEFRHHDLLSVTNRIYIAILAL